MIKTLLLLTLFAGFAGAETTPEEQAQLEPQTEPNQPVPEDAPAKVGYEKAENNVFPKTASYDGKWTVNGLSILDAQGKVAFKWKDMGAIWRLYMTVSWSLDSWQLYMTVSWSLDSQRVILLDQFGRGAKFYAVELLNGVWVDVKNAVNLNPVEARFVPPSKGSLVDHVDLGQWASVTAIQIQDHFLIRDKDTHSDAPVMAQWKDATAILQFSNGSLRLVN
jgi:hypothetical protein